MIPDSRQDGSWFIQCRSSPIILGCTVRCALITGRIGARFQAHLLQLDLKSPPSAHGSASPWLNKRNYFQEQSPVGEKGLTQLAQKQSNTFFFFLKLSPQCESPELKLIRIWSKSLNAQRERERWKQIQWESLIERVSTLWKLRTRVHKKTGDDSRGVADGAGYGNRRTMGGSGDGGSGGYTMCRINSKTCGPKNKTHKVDMNTVG